MALFGNPAVRLTRKQISASLNATTAGLVLPRMVERGLLDVDTAYRPYVYRRCDATVSIATDSIPASCVDPSVPEKA